MLFKTTLIKKKIPSLKYDNLKLIFEIKYQFYFFKRPFYQNN